MEIRDIDYFIAVAETRGFSLAAKRLHISQPALSRYIGNMERRLGVSLFERTGRQLSLTYSGERYLIHAREIRERLLLLDEEMRRITERQGDRLRIGFIRSGRQLKLPNAIARFRNLYPEVELNITEGLSKDLELAVLKGGLDFAFISEPSEPSGFEFRFLESHFALIALPPGRPEIDSVEFRDGLPYPWVDLRLLMGETFVLQNENCRMRLDLDRLFSLEDFSPQVSMYTQSTLDAIRFTEMGIGACFITEGYALYISDKSEIQLFCVGTPPFLTKFGVISKKGAALPKAADDFARIYMESGDETKRGLPELRK